DEPAVGDLAVGNGDALGGRCACDGHGSGVVHDQRGLVVAEGGDQFRALEDLYERTHKAPVGLCALQAPGWCVADDVIGDVAHGLVQVVTGPCVVVGQRGPQRGAGGVGHRFSFLAGTVAVGLGICVRPGPGSSVGGDVSTLPHTC